MPEERHLLLQRSAGVHHPEQPALARIFDVGVGRESTGTRHDADVCRVPDLRIDVVGQVVVVQQAIEQLERRHVFIRLELLGTRAESRTPRQMLYPRSASCHGNLPRKPRPIIPLSSVQWMNRLLFARQRMSKLRQSRKSLGKTRAKRTAARRRSSAPTAARPAPPSDASSGLAPGMHPINTYLAVANVAATIEFLERAFGFTRGVVLPDADGQLRYAEMRHQDSVVMLIRRGDVATATGGAAALYTYVS